jgi:hypothetical protein
MEYVAEAEVFELGIYPMRRGTRQRCRPLGNRGRMGVLASGHTATTTLSVTP